MSSGILCRGETGMLADTIRYHNSELEYSAVSYLTPHQCECKNASLGTTHRALMNQNELAGRDLAKRWVAKKRPGGGCGLSDGGQERSGSPIVAGGNKTDGSYSIELVCSDDKSHEHERIAVLGTANER